MSRKIHILLLGLLLSASAMAWDWWPVQVAMRDSSAYRKGADTLQYAVTAEALASSGTFAPFWLQSNRQGRISAAPFGGYLTAAISKSATSPQRWFDYDFAAEITASCFSSEQGLPMSSMSHFPSWSGKHGAFQINQLYAHARLYVIDIAAGVRPMRSCLPNADLSMGGLLFSPNSPAIPGISIGMEEYVPIPGCYGYLELKGHIGHYWLTDDTYIEGALLHYKHAGARAGGNLPVHLSYEIHHVSQWGGISPEYGDLGNDLRSYWNAFSAGAGGGIRSGELLAQGNHIVMQQWMINLDWKGWHAAAYWQTLFEDNSLKFSGFGTAGRDGLFGATLSQDHWPFISGLCLEYMGTTDQSGPFHDQDGLIFAGNDDYYQHSIYRNGWTYFGRTICNPFITSPVYNEGGEIETLNNRVKVWHIGINGDIYGFRYRLLASHAKNYGTYWDKDVYSMKSCNTALLLEVNKHVEKAWGLDFGLRLAGDLGTQFGNTFGAMLTISKRGIVTHW